jgi:hypothetical protein
MNELTKNEDLDRLKKACGSLAEYFDTVQIFCTRKTDAGTINCRWGIGDFFARYGHCRMWLLREETGGLGGERNEKKDWE